MIKNFVDNASRQKDGFLGTLADIEILRFPDRNHQIQFCEGLSL